jgi:hypothetical protein
VPQTDVVGLGRRRSLFIEHIVVEQKPPDIPLYSDGEVRAASIASCSCWIGTTKVLICLILFIFHYIAFPNFNPSLSLSHSQQQDGTYYTTKEEASNEQTPPPHVVWLMSFPNSVCLCGWQAASLLLILY